MNWTEPKPPTDGVSYYNHTICETPIGKFIIEWKSWKENDSYDITKDSNVFVGYGDTLEEAKEIVKDYLITKNNELSAFLGLKETNKDDVNNECEHPYNFVTGKKMDLPTCQKCGKIL